MDTPYVMNRAQVKKFLSITGSEYDVRIDTFLPAVSDALVGAYGFLHKYYLIDTIGTLSAGSIDITNMTDTALAMLSEGDILYAGPTESDGPDALEIMMVNRSSGSITMSGNLSGTGASELTFRIVPNGAKPYIAQAVLARMSSGTIEGATAAAAGDKKSEKYGPVSITYGGGGQIGVSGFPAAIEKALLPYRRPYFL